MKAYKMFRMKKKYPGKLFPLFVSYNEEVEMGVWLDAKEGERLPTGKVKSRIGPLAFRPGWHLSDIPLAVHIGIKEDGVIRYMHDDEVWCECEYSDDKSYQDEADRNGTVGGKLVPVKAQLKHIPENGFYRYKTNPMMLGTWIIAGRLKVNRILSDGEVGKLCRMAGYEALPHRKSS